MDDAQITKALAAIEAQIKLLSDAAGVACPPFPGVALASGAGEAAGVPDDVVALARAGNTTQAISRLRQLTGATIPEAKKIVDAL